MSLSYRNLDASKNINESFLKPFGRSEDDGFSGACPRVYFTCHQGDIDLRARITRDEFCLFEAKVVREEPADNINRGARRTEIRSVRRPPSVVSLNWSARLSCSL